MRVDIRRPVVVAGITTAIYSLASLLVALDPSGADALFGRLFHRDIPAFVRVGTWRSFLAGALAAGVTVSVAVGLSGWLFHRRAKREETGTRFRAPQPGGGSRAASEGLAGDLAASGRFPYHREETVVVFAPTESVFAYLDAPDRLGDHMSRSSWMMAGSRMTIELDGAKGRAVDSVIRLRGRVLGMRVEADEVITERTPPFRKSWETVGTPRLLVVGPYRMRFEISPRSDSCQLRLEIDYRLPEQGIDRLLGRLFGGFYARWCLVRMAQDAVRDLGGVAPGSPAANTPEVSGGSGWEGAAWRHPSRGATSVPTFGSSQRR